MYCTKHIFYRDSFLNMETVNGRYHFSICILYNFMSTQYNMTNVGTDSLKAKVCIKKKKKHTLLYAVASV